MMPPRCELLDRKTQQPETKTNCPLVLSLPAQLERVATVDTQQVFQLIDRVLPFEACLYHQILPLSLKDECLQLGMVTLEDAVALDYVRQILKFMNYSLVPQTITSDVHYATLSAYLNHVGKRVVVPPLDNSVLTQEPGVAENVDLLEETSLLDQNPHEVSDPTSSKNHSTYSAQEAKETFLLDSLDEIDNSLDLSPPATVVLDPPFQPQNPKPSLPGNALPTLEVSTDYLNSPSDHLAVLPSAQLLQELLGRILMGGIGRLYLERRSTTGRILWSQNGVVQSVLNDLPLSSFQGVIDELKQLTHLPLTPVQQPKQVEIERLCRQSRLLLRLRVMPSAHGEEATLQVLRGAALKFYQQQQVANLSRDALNIAKNLQQKVREIHDRTIASAQLSSDQANLTQILQIVEQQIKALKQTDEG
ncbi:MAG: hypothetical protein LH660_15865 [Phormidesmis sp. CAN_BIN36]|nr:hypothetical protein [Phormidesmis sp. CAN_BIN36]